MTMIQQQYNPAWCCARKWVWG